MSVGEVTSGIVARVNRVGSTLAKHGKHMLSSPVQPTMKAEPYPLVAKVKQSRHIEEHVLVAPRIMLLTLNISAVS